MTRTLTEGQRKVRKSKKSSTPHDQGINRSQSAACRRIPMPLTTTSDSCMDETTYSTTDSTSGSSMNDSTLPPLPETPIVEATASTESTTSSGQDMASFMAEQRAFNERVLGLLENQASRTQAKSKKERLPLKLTVRDTFVEL